MKKKMKKMLPMFFGCMIGGIAGFFGADALFVLKPSASEVLIAFAIMLIVYYIQVILHEGGHLIFGLLSGYQFVSFRVGSFIVYKTNGTYKVGKYKLTGTGGQCLMAPPDVEHDMIPYRLFNFGGAILNLVSVIPAAVLLAVGATSGFGRVFAILWCVIGLLSAIMNGIPMSMGAVDNDGKNAMNLGKNPKALYAFWLQLKVNQMQMDGKTLLEMPGEWFERPSYEEMDNPMVAVIGAMYCNYLMEAKNYEKTSQAIEEMLKNASGLLPVHYMLLQIDQIYCEIMSTREAKILENFQDKNLQKFIKAMKNYPSVIRTNYAYARCIEKDEKKAERVKKQFEKIMSSHPNAAELHTELEFISDCENTELS